MPAAVINEPVAEPVAAAGPGKANVAFTGISDNNYSRPSGQNVGNFLTDKPSSRVLAPPGGGSSLRIG
jgi:protein SPIRAL1 and related proteins